MTSTQQPGRKTTRKDVARLAGVSDAVVSYTLNGGAPVAPATAQRVLEAVAALGYRPNQAAVALKSGSARTFALILPVARDPLLANPFFTELIAAVESAAYAHGYALHVTTVADEPGCVTTRCRELASRQTDGVLLVPGYAPPEAALLDAVGMPWMQLNTPIPLPGIASVGVDLRSGSVLATEHLIAHGYRSIGFVGPMDGAEPRRDGWEEACAAHGLERGAGIDSGFSRQAGHAAGLRLATLGAQRPDAVFAASDMIAVGLLRALHESGIRVPDDVAIVSFDGSWDSEYSWPALTSVRQPITRMAEHAIAWLRGPRNGEAPHELLSGTLIVRESCGAHPLPE